MYPKVSVIIRASEKCTYLSQAIESVTGQTYPNIEIIIADEYAHLAGRAESPEAIIEKYSRLCDITYLSGASSLNAAIEKSTGEYTAFLEESGEYFNQYLECHLKFMMMHKLSFSYSDTSKFIKSGKSFHTKISDNITDWSADTMFRNHIAIGISPLSSFMFRRDFLIEIGGFRNAGSGRNYMLVYDAIEYNRTHPEARLGYFPCSYISFNPDVNEKPDSAQRIKNENELYAVKLAGAEKLDNEDKKYIDFRHYAVLARIASQDKNTKETIKNLFKAFMISPDFTLTQFKKVRPD